MKELTHEERQKISWQLAAGHDLEDIMDTHPDASVYIIYEPAENPPGVKVLDYFWSVEEMDRERPRTFPDTNSWEYERVSFFVAQELTGPEKTGMYDRLEEAVSDTYRDAWNKYAVLDELCSDLESTIEKKEWPVIYRIRALLDMSLRQLLNDDTSEIFDNEKYVFEALAVIEEHHYDMKK